MTSTAISARGTFGLAAFSHQVGRSQFKEFMMITPSRPINEPQRLETLRALKVLDSAPEERFDRLTRLAKRLFGVPIALVSLVDADRQWFKSCIGLDATETSRDVSFCGHAILEDDVLVVPDALADVRFHDNPLVNDAPNIRFYAGCPLTVVNGSKLGTLCLIDVNPREMSEDDLVLLRDLARMAEQELSAVQLATTDELTKISNRRGFETLATHALNTCQRLERPATMLFFDLNGFKAVNDTFGHAEGDHALVTFAEILLQSMRQSDVVGRLGGDEFVVLLTSTTAAETEVILRRMQEDLDRKNQEAQRGYDIRFSVGSIEFDLMNHKDIHGVLGAADSAMYENKARSKAALH
jgi:diguanylate cyclase (GGDEF)-like protein